MQLRVLGPLDLVDDQGRDATPLTQPRLRALLAALAVHAGAVVARDVLVEAVWDAQPPRDTVASLHTLVSRLRSALRGADDGGATLTLETAPTGYVLHAARGAIDAHDFETTVEESRRLGTSDPPAAVRTLERGLALWRGPAYAEFATTPFVRAEAVRLEELRGTAACELVDHLLAADRVDDAIRSLEALLVARPLDERPHAQAMVALARAGRPADALAVFRDLRDRLGEELGLDPSPALQRLETRILRQDPALGTGDGAGRGAPDAAGRSAADGGAATEVGIGAGDVGGPTSATSGGGGSRPPRPRLLGRDELVAEVAARLDAGRFVTLTGPGGVGKTALASGVADRAAGADLWFVELASVAGDDEVAPAVATALGLERRSATAIVDRVAAFLSVREGVLVLDNCEHVVEGAAALAARLWGSCPRLHLLATSREPLHVTGEQVVRVPPLPTPPPDTDLEALAASPSVALFLERARAVEAGFGLHVANAADVHRLVRRLDGLPLAIELAASKMAAMTPGDVAERLTWRFRVLRGANRQTPRRHRTLRAVIDWSYELLDDEHRTVFTRLAVFPASFDLAAAEAVVAGASDLEAPDVADALAALVDRSLVARADDLAGDGRAGRYVLLETLRAYGRERLEQADLALRTRRAHARHYLALAERLAADIPSPVGSAAIAALDRELANLRAVHRYALAHDLDLSERLFRSLFLYVERRLPPEVFAWAEAAANAGAPTASSAPALLVAASGARFRGELERTDELLRRAEPAARGDDVLDYLHYLRSECDLFAGRLAASSGGHAPPVRSFFQLSAWITDILADAYSGRRAEARAAATDMQAWRDTAVPDTDDPAAGAWVDYALAEIVAEDRPDEAAARFDRALTVANDCGDRYLLGVTLISAAALAARRGAPEDALRRFADALRHWGDAGGRMQQWTTVRNLVELLARLGADTAAATLYGAARDRATAGPVFGAPGARLEQIAAELRDRLGADAWRTAVEDGAALDDDRVVARADAVLRQLLDQRSR